MLATEHSATPSAAQREQGIIAVEKKDEVTKRLGRSTDAADAVVMGMFRERNRRRRLVTHVGPNREDEEAA